MNRLVIVLTLVLAASAGCAKSGERCHAEVAELVAFLRAMDHSPPVLDPDVLHVRYAMRPELPTGTVENGPLVIATPGKASFQGQPASASALAAEVQRRQDDFDHGRMPKAALAHFDAHQVLVVVDRDTPWREVASLADMLVHGNMAHVTWVFGKPSPVAPPPHTAMDDRLNALPETNQATSYADIMSEFVRQCPALRPSEQLDATSDHVVRRIDATERGLADCKCGVDMAQLRTFLWRWLGNKAPIATLQVALDEHAAPLALPAAMPWSEAARHIPASGSFWPVGQ